MTRRTLAISAVLARHLPLRIALNRAGRFARRVRAQRPGAQNAAQAASVSRPLR